MYSVYPKFPSNSSDNRYHLQACRHFYVLAMEKRIVVTKDADTGELVHVPLNIYYRNGYSETLQSPILIRDLGNCRQVQVIEGEYHFLDLNSFSSSIYVKKKIGQQSKDSDIKTNRLYRALCQEFEVSDSDYESWVGSGSEPQSFYTTVFEIIPRLKSSLTEDLTALEKHRQFCSTILTECHRHEKMDILPKLLTLNHRLANLDISTRYFVDFRHLAEIYTSRLITSGLLVNQEFVENFTRYVKRFFTDNLNKVELENYRKGTGLCFLPRIPGKGECGMW